jgi:hypothetical protein
MSVDGSGVPGWLWLVGALFLFAGVVEFLEDDDDSALWRDTGRLSTLITFVLLVVAYAFYGDQQSRGWWEAVKDLGQDQLESVVPVAILTQFVLLVLFWLLLGRMLGMPWKALLEPIYDLVRVAGLFVGLLIFTVALLGALNGNAGYVVLGLAGLAATSYLIGVSGSSLELRARYAAHERARAEAGKPPRSAVYTAMWGSPDRSTRWRQPIGGVLFGLVLQLFVYGIFAGITAGIMHWMDRGVPGLGPTLRIELIVATIAMLAFCYYFRTSASEQPDTPPILFHFVDLSLVLSAGVVALTGLPGSSVTVGPVPSLVVAVGPSIVVAVVIFAVHLARGRSTTRNWGNALVVSVGAGAVAVPVKLFLTAALVPFVGLLPLPSW